MDKASIDCALQASIIYLKLITQTRLSMNRVQLINRNDEKSMILWKRLIIKKLNCVEKEKSII